MQSTLKTAIVTLAVVASLPAPAHAQPAPTAPAAAPLPPPKRPSADQPPVVEQGTTTPPADRGPAAPSPPTGTQAPAGQATVPVPDDVIEITVIGEKPNALQKVPGSGTVVSEKELKRAQPQDVAEMLRRVPGITAREERDGGNRIDISVRGFDAPRGRNVLLLEDGIPLPLNPYGEPDTYYGPPIDRMRGIEVVKGSGSILFGPQTLGGVINFLTIAPPERRELDLAIFGGDPAYLKMRARYGDTVGDGSTRYVAQIMHERGEGFRNQPFQATDFLSKVTFPTSTFGEATVKISLHDEVDHSTQAGLTHDMFIQDPRRPTLGPYDRMRVRKYDVALIHDLPFSSVTTLRTLVFAYTTSRIWRNQLYDRAPVPGERYERIVGDPSTPGDAIYYKYATTIPDRSYDVVGVEPRLEHEFSTGRLKHDLITGARFLGETAHRAQRLGDTPTSYAGSLQSDEYSHTYAFAAYAEDKMAASEYLLITPGMRFEYAQSQRTIDRAYVNGQPADVNIVGTTEVHELLPGIGMVAGSKDNHGFGGVHVGFAPPRVTSAITGAGVNHLLGAQRSLNWELGARLAPSRWSHVEATGFLVNYENQVIPAVGADRQGELQDAGQTRHYGVETGGNLQLGEALHLGMDVDLMARYTFAHAFFVGGVKNGKLLPYAPLHTASGTLDVEHPIGLGAQISANYIGEQITDEMDTIQEDSGGRIGLIKAHVIVDVAARYRHARTGLTATVSVKNLLDQPYVYSRRPDGIFPSGFRQITVGLEWAYAAAPKPQ